MANWRKWLGIDFEPEPLTPAELMSGPPAPTNVRIVTQDGRELAVDCIYTGQDDDLMHMWVAIVPDGVEWAQIKIGRLPPRTSISLASRKTSQE